MFLSVIKSIFNFQSQSISIQWKHFVAFYKFRNVYIHHYPFQLPWLIRQIHTLYVFLGDNPIFLNQAYNIFNKEKKICTYTADYGRISVWIIAIIFLKTKFKVNAPNILVKLSWDQWLAADEERSSAEPPPPHCIRLPNASYTKSKYWILIDGGARGHVY